MAIERSSQGLVKFSGADAEALRESDVKIGALNYLKRSFGRSVTLKPEIAKPYLEHCKEQALQFGQSLTQTQQEQLLQKYDQAIDVCQDLTQPTLKSYKKLDTDTAHLEADNFNNNNQNPPPLQSTRGDASSSRQLGLEESSVGSITRGESFRRENPLFEDDTTSSQTTGSSQTAQQHAVSVPSVSENSSPIEAPPKSQPSKPVKKGVRINDTESDKLPDALKKSLEQQRQEHLKKFSEIKNDFDASVGKLKIRNYIKTLDTPQKVSLFIDMFEKNFEKDDAYKKIINFAWNRMHEILPLTPPDANREDAAETMHYQVGYMLTEADAESLITNYINQLKSKDQLDMLESELNEPDYDFETDGEDEENPPSWIKTLQPLIEKRRAEIGTDL